MEEIYNHMGKKVFSFLLLNLILNVPAVFGQNCSLDLSAAKLPVGSSGAEELAEELEEELAEKIFRAEVSSDFFSIVKWTATPDSNPYNEKLGKEFDEFVTRLVKISKSDGKFWNDFKRIAELCRTDYTSGDDWNWPAKIVERSIRKVDWWGETLLWELRLNEKPDLKFVEAIIRFLQTGQDEISYPRYISEIALKYPNARSQIEEITVFYLKNLDQEADISRQIFEERLARIMFDYTGEWGTPKRYLDLFIRRGHLPQVDPIEFRPVAFRWLPK